jgi:hypothetical protein
LVAVSYASDLYPFFNMVRNALNRTTGGCTGASCHTGGQNPRFDLAPNTLFSQLLNPAPLTPTNRYVDRPPPDTTFASATVNLLFNKPGGGVSHTGLTFPSNRVTIIKAWIQQGALDN